MAEAKYCKLVMVTGENNNKFYEMTYSGTGGTFTATYGRIEMSSKSIQKSLGDWEKLKKSKEKKGYKDVTHLASVVEKEESTGKVIIKKIDDKIVNDFLVKMKNYTDGLVSKTYSVKSTSVSQAQVDEAQSILDKLAKIKKTTSDKDVNTMLLELYTIIPRYMSHVPSYLMPNIKSRLDKHIIQEQDNLDAMAGQVAANQKAADKLKGKKKDEVIETTLLDQMGITMSKCDGIPSDIKYITDQLNGNKVQGIYEISKGTEEARFDKWMGKQSNKETRHLIHGTRCSSVIPILDTSLQIRPAGNFQFSGKAYGNGNYFSEKTIKSLGYTGYDDDQVLLVYEVHTGNPFVYSGWYQGNSFTLSYKELSKRGFDSTHVAAGNGLLNSEIIAYKEEQCRIKYAIWLKRR